MEVLGNDACICMHTKEGLPLNLSVDAVPRKGNDGLVAHVEPASRKNNGEPEELEKVVIKPIEGQDAPSNHALRSVRFDLSNTFKISN